MKLVEMKLTAIFIATLITLSVLNACREARKTGSRVVTEKIRKSGEPLHQPDSNFFDKPVAVVISPNERLIAKTKKELDEESYNTVVDDDVWYMSESGQYLDSVKANQVRRCSEGKLRFMTKAGKIYTMQIDTVFFGVILFNGKSKPVTADITDMPTEYSNYMK